jgi:1,4-dihydroxy-2-naphthoyl-CoA hydrolase
MINPNVSVEDLNKQSENTLVSHLGIVCTEIGKDYICATMPVNGRTIQPFGLLHGGASVALAETLGSFGSSCCIEHHKQMVVGLEINANHVRSVREGFVLGTARLLHFGKKTHIWDIRIENESRQLVCISRITIAILDKPSV